MATYECVKRTNVFAVNDEEKFADLMECWKDQYDVLELDTMGIGVDSKRRHCFGSMSDFLFTEEDIQKLQSLLPEGEVFVLYEIGHEKWNDLLATATILTRDSLNYMSLLDAVDSFIVNEFNKDITPHGVAIRESELSPETVKRSTGKEKSDEKTK